MPNPVTQFPLIVDQQLLQTLRMGISALQILANEADVRLNLAVQAALDAANRVVAEEDPPKSSESDPPIKSRARNGHAEAS